MQASCQKDFPHIIDSALAKEILLPDDCRQTFGRFDAQLFVDIHAPEHDLDMADRYAEFIGQKPHHVVGCPPGPGGGRDTDTQLVPLDLADGILF